MTSEIEGVAIWLLIKRRRRRLCVGFISYPRSELLGSRIRVVLGCFCPRGNGLEIGDKGVLGAGAFALPRYVLARRSEIPRGWIVQVEIKNPIELLLMLALDDGNEQLHTAAQVA